MRRFNLAFTDGNVHSGIVSYHEDGQPCQVFLSELVLEASVKDQRLVATVTGKKLVKNDQKHSYDEAPFIFKGELVNCLLMLEQD